MQTPFYNLIYNILAPHNLKVVPVEMARCGRMTSINECTFISGRTQWRFSSITNDIGHIDTLESENGRIHYKLVLKDHSPKCFYVNDTEYPINQFNLKFILRTFPHLKDYFKINSGILESLKNSNPKKENIKPNALSLFWLYFLSFFKS